MGLVSRSSLQARLHGQGLLQGDVELFRHQLGDLVHFRVRRFQGPAHVPDHLAGLHAPEGGDVGHVRPAVGLGDVFDDLSPALVAEVHVDIRRADPLGIEEALEKEAEGQGVQVGDLQGIGHQAPGRGSPAGPHRYPAPPGEIDDVGHHQEVAGKPHLHQDIGLVFQALPVIRLRGPGMIGRGRQALGQPLPGLPGHEGLHAVPAGNGEGREMVGAELQGNVAAGRNLHRGRQHLGIGEDAGHLRRTLKIELVRLELHAARGVHGLAGLDAQQDVVGPGVFGLQIVDVVGGHHRQTPAGTQFQQGLVDLELLRQVVGLDLQVEPIL